MAKAVTDIRSLARSHTRLAINTLAGIARHGESEPARVSAAVALLERGWGKAQQNVEVDATFNVIVRRLVDESDQRLVDVTPNKLDVIEGD